MSNFLKNTKGDKVIWVVVAILSFFSILAVYSSTGTLAYKKHSGNTEYYLMKQLFILFFGLGLMWITHKIKYTYYSRISVIALAISIPMLVVTLFSGTNLNEASRWLTLPVINLTFQSSDLAKLALIMYVARLLTVKQAQIKDFKTAFIPIMVPIIIVCGLILPANFSTAALLFATCLVLMFIGRVNLKFIFALLGIGIIAFSIFLLVLYNLPKDSQGRLGTWKSRIESFTHNNDPEVNYQSDQSKIAIATGGILGKTPGKSTQRNFLPHPYSDFIFAIIVEEYGLIGAIILILMYLILLYRAVRIVTRNPQNFGAFLTIGVTFSLVFQALINMAVAVDLFPVTGQPLPLVSMGGTSLWFTSIGIGIILSVSKEIDTPQKTEPVYA